MSGRQDTRSLQHTVFLNVNFGLPVAGTKPASGVDMAACRLLDVMAVALLAVVSCAEPARSQPSTAPPSSLTTTPLKPNMNDPADPATCDLCRPLEGRPGSDLPRHGRLRHKDMRPQKKVPGLTTSPRRSLTSQLPHRKLEEHGHEDK